MPGIKPTEGRWVLKGRERVRFEVGPYDRGKTLLIEPGLGCSTYLGGTGSDYGHNAAIDASVGGAKVTV
jgi:hypothetical protein